MSDAVTVIPIHGFRGSPHIEQYICVGCDTIKRRLDHDRICKDCAEDLIIDAYERLLNGEVVYGVGERGKLKVR